jgi:predicted secreted protein
MPEEQDMRRPWAIYLISIALCPAGGAQADELQYGQVSFTVQAERELQNDLAEAVLAAEADQTDPAKVADDINRTMAWALDQARGVEGVTAQTGEYQTYPIYDDKGRLQSWRGSQALILRGPKIEALSALAGRLQQRLQIKTMHFTPSPERRRFSEEQLTDRLLAQFKERAGRIQRDLGAKSYRIVRLDVGNAGEPQALTRMALSGTAGAPVAAEAGSSRIRLSVHATIQLEF